MSGWKWFRCVMHKPVAIDFIGAFIIADVFSVKYIRHNIKPLKNFLRYIHFLTQGCKYPNLPVGTCPRNVVEVHRTEPAREIPYIIPSHLYQLSFAHHHSSFALPAYLTSIHNEQMQHHSHQILFEPHPCIASRTFESGRFQWDWLEEYCLAYP